MKIIVSNEGAADLCLKVMEKIVSEMERGGKK